MTECDVLGLDFGGSDDDGDQLYLGFVALSENMTFDDNGDGTGHFEFAPNFSQAGDYPLEFYLTDAEDTAWAYFTISVEECEPGTEGDTVTVATVPAVPGAQVVHIFFGLPPVQAMPQVCVTIRLGPHPA